MQGRRAANIRRDLLLLVFIALVNPPQFRIVSQALYDMASFICLGGIFRRSQRLVQCRDFTSTTARQNDATSNLAVQKKPIGGFRGGYIIITIVFSFVNIVF